MSYMQQSIAVLNGRAVFSQATSLLLTYLCAHLLLPPYFYLFSYFIYVAVFNDAVSTVYATHTHTHTHTYIYIYSCLNLGDVTDC
jgi:hypothetical protein